MGIKNKHLGIMLLNSYTFAIVFWVTIRCIYPLYGEAKKEQKQQKSKLKGESLDSIYRYDKQRTVSCPNVRHCFYRNDYKNASK